MGGNPRPSTEEADVSSTRLQELMVLYYIGESSIQELTVLNVA